MKRCVAGAIFLATSIASAHDLGISRAALVERENGSFHGRFAFAARESAAAFDRDGHVAIEVTTDGAPCTPERASTTPDGDGVIVEEDFTCARAFAKVTVTANFVSAMSSTHEDIMRIETPEAAREELLTSAHRTVTLELDRKKPATTTRASTVVIAILGAIAVALAAMAIRYKLRP